MAEQVKGAGEALTPSRSTPAGQETAEPTKSELPDRPSRSEHDKCGPFARADIDGNCFDPAVEASERRRGTEELSRP